ncbi:MAG: DUF2303 family protein [Pseudomonas sp.]|nr:DUF2303 family protein [Pseudomonas sp.]
MQTKEALELIVNTAISNTNGLNDQLSEATEGLMIAPSDFHLIDLEKQMPSRRRFRGRYKTTDIENFAEYANTHTADAIFINTDSMPMDALAIFDLGCALEPGHAEHTAVLALTNSPAYKAARNINGERLKQGELADFIEDWLPQLEILCDGEVQNPLQAIQAIRNITITASMSAQHGENHFSASRSAIEEIEARSVAHKLPTHISFTLIPHTGFDPLTISFRVAVITDKEAPRLTLRWMQQDIQEQEIGENFKNLIANGITGDNTDIHIGTFNAN